MANEFKIKNGLYVSGSTTITNDATVTGSLVVSGGITGSLLGTSSYAVQALSSSFAFTSSYSLSGTGFPYSGSAVITGSLLVTNLSGSGVRYVITDQEGNITAQTASAAIKVTQTYTASAGQTTFSVANGYSTGYVDVFINGTKLNGSEFTDTSGTNIVLATGSFNNDVVEVVKYLPASGVSNNVLRTLTTFTATESQSIFNVDYTPGLLDIFYNGSRLSPIEYTANNGTDFTLATASNAGDILDVMVYSYQVGAYAGIGGSGQQSQVAYYTTTSSISGSNNFTFDGSTLRVTGSIISSGSSTFVNIGPTILSGSLTVSGSITATEGIIISGSIASASYASNAERLDNLDSTSFVFTSSYNTDSSSLSTRVTNNEATGSSLTIASGSFSGRITTIESKYATTGSNIFTANQTICGNLTTTGTITAQTINVQQVTSSVVYSCGSNIFGCQLSDTQQFTGSMFITGSTLNLNGESICTPGNVYIGSNLSACSVVNVGLNLRISTSSFAGNASDPAITTGGCTKAGVYFAGSCVGLGSGGNTLILSPSGRVGIGTENPNFGNLSILCADNTTVSSVLWGTSTGAGVVASVYNTSQCVNSVAGLRLVTRNSGASVWNIYNVSIGNDTGDLAFGNGSGGTGYEKLRIFQSGITCFACRVCAPQFLATFNADGDNIVSFINSASSFTYNPGGVFIASSTAHNCTALNAGAGALIIRNGASTYTAAISYNGQAYFCNRVGINTASPTFKLDVQDNTQAVIRVLDTCCNNSLILQAGSGAGMKITGYNYNTSTAIPLYISVDGADTIMQRSGGNVGIGVVSPSYKLDIASGASGVVLNLEGTNAYNAETGILMSSGRAKISGFLNGSGGTPGTSLRFYTMPDGGSVTERLRIDSIGVACFACRPQFPGASLICSYTCTFSSYTAGTWIGLFAGDNGFNGAYAFTVIGQFNLNGSPLYSMNYATVPYIHKSDLIGSTNGNAFTTLQYNQSGHADNGIAVAFRRAMYTSNSPVGNRTEFCMSTSYNTTFTATTYVLAWV